MLSTSARGLVTRNGEPVEIEKSALRIPVYATDFGRYSFQPHAEERVIFPYRVTNTGYSIIGESELRRSFPKTCEYLRSRKRELLKRRQFKDWFGFSAPRNLDLHDRAQLMVPLLANTGSCCVLPDDMVRYCPMASGGFTISVLGSNTVSSLYLVALLNSKLLFYVLRNLSNRFRGGWITCTKQYVGKLPVRTIDFADHNEKSRHDRIVELVEAMLALHRKMPIAKTPHETTLIQRQISAADRQIDRLVYELYGLSDDEIKIVEEATLPIA